MPSCGPVQRGGGGHFNPPGAHRVAPHPEWRHLRRSGTAGRGSSGSPGGTQSAHREGPRYVTKKPLEIQIQNLKLLKTFSRPLFDEDSIALVSAGSLALVFELRCIDSKFSKNRKKGHARGGGISGVLLVTFVDYASSLDTFLA